MKISYLFQETISVENKVVKFSFKKLFNLNKQYYK